MSTVSKDESKNGEKLQVPNLWPAKMRLVPRRSVIFSPSLTLLFIVLIPLLAHHAHSSTSIFPPKIPLEEKGAQVALDAKVQSRNFSFPVQV